MSRAIVIGGGPNGLAASITLAQAGHDVTVVESRSEVGGRCGLLHDTSLVQQSLASTLGLDVEWTAAAPLSQAMPDGVRVIDDSTPGVGEWRRGVAGAARLVAQLAAVAPPDIRKNASPLTLIGPALAALKLGRAGGLELARFGPMCAEDWLDEWGIERTAQAALCAPALQGTWMGPRSPTSALAVLTHYAFAGQQVTGGMKVLLSALTARASALGVSILTDSPVAEIQIKDGSVSGVLLGDERTLAADVVLSTVGPRLTLMELIDAQSLPFGLEAAVTNVRTRGIIAVMTGAVSAPLFDGAERVIVADNTESLERAFDDAKHRRVPSRPCLDVSQVNGVIKVLVYGAPIDIDGGWTDEAKVALQKNVLAVLAEYTETDSLTDATLLTPADLQSEYGLEGGHLYHGEFALDQFLSFRPHPSLCRYKTPISGLFLGGAGMHPAGGFTLAQGVLSAQAVGRP